MSAPKSSDVYGSVATADTDEDPEMNEPDSNDRKVVVQLFGGPVVNRTEEPVHLSPHQAALITLVFGHRRGIVSRKEATWLIWAKDDGPKVRHSLRSLLHHISQKTGHRIIATPEDQLVPDLTAASSDLVHFELMMKNGLLLDAANLVSSGFGRGCSHPPSREFEDWLDSRRASLADRIVRAAADVWDKHDGTEQWAEVHGAVESLYKLRPRDPHVLAKVIETRARLGRGAGAEAAYAEHLSFLRHGEAPHRLLEQLIHRVRASEPINTKLGASAPRDVPLVGREDALSVARTMVKSMDQGGFQVLVVRGKPGIGKTRFLEEVQRQALLSGCRCLSASPIELERRIALNPIIDALSSVDVRPHLDQLGEPWKAVISSILPASATNGPLQEIPAIQESGLSRRLLDAFRMLFDRIAAEGPVVLIIDDLQWADPTTLALLKFIERRWESGGFCLICAVRPAVLSQQDSLESFLLRSDLDGGHFIDLTELNDSEARELLRHVSKDTLEAGTERYLCQLAANHPFYLTELAKDFLSGRLALPSHRLDAIPIPVSLQQIFNSRIKHLSVQALRVASLLAVRARPMRLVEISDLLGINLEESADQVEQLDQWHFVDVSQDSIRISHELFRSALYNHISEARRALIHGMIAQSMEMAGPADVLGELAIHYSRAGERNKAAQFGKTAAREALDCGALTAAAQYFEIVVQNLSDPADRAESTADLAKTLYRDRQISKANPMLELAANRLRKAGNPLRARRMEIRRVEGLSELGTSPMEDLLARLSAVNREAEVVGDWEAVALGLDTELRLRHRSSDVSGIRRTFTELRKLVAVTSPPAACVCHMGLAIEVLFGDTDAAETSARIAVRISNGLPIDYQVRARVRQLFVDLHRGKGYTPDSLRIAAQARAIALTSGDLAQRYYLEVNHGVLQLDSGDLDQAEAAFNRAGGLLGVRDLSLSRLTQAYNMGELYIARGDFGTALRHLEEALTLAGAGCPDYLRELILAGTGLCALEMGDLSAARRSEDALGSPPPDLFYDPSTILVFRARMLVRRGHIDEAIGLLNRWRDRVRDRFVLSWLKLTLELVRLGSRSGLRGLPQIIAEATTVADELYLARRVEQLTLLGRSL
mgnify:CR=1 FL=1